MITSAGYDISIIHNQYCVYHTTYFGTLMPQNYIGSSSVHKVMKENYRGSVSSKKYKIIWKSELKLHPELFNTTIISYHDTRPSALWKELQVQKIFNVVKSHLFVNMAYAAPNGYCGMDVSGINSPNYGIPKTQEHRDKISKSQTGSLNHNYGIVQSEELNKKHSDRMTGTGNPRYGIHLDQELKDIISNTISSEWYILSPSGISHTIPNLRKFCFDNGLNYKSAVHCAWKGTIPRRGINKDWQFIQNKSTSKFKVYSKPRINMTCEWDCYDSNNVKYTTSHLKTFYEEYSLNYNSALSSSGCIRMSGPNIGWKFIKLNNHLE